MHLVLAFRYLTLSLPSFTFFPYTTLFRSFDYFFWNAVPAGVHLSNIFLHVAAGLLLYRLLRHVLIDKAAGQQLRARSEEHPSELQSRFELVCRLLLEKKNEAERWRRAVRA